MLHVAVAVSGGRDSTALLHCTAHAALALGLQVHALHVHHGLHADADAWAQQVEKQVQRWAKRGLPVHFHLHRVNDSPRPGDSVEAWARQRRYAALASMAQQANCTLVLLAHHRRDQAETVLLQALRGAGPAGLSAMPRMSEREGLMWARPWLDQPRQSIEAYVRRHRLAYVDDRSNNDIRFARNRLRQSVWPAFEAAFPDAEISLVAVAQQAQDARVCLEEIAGLDLAVVADETGFKLKPWLALSEPRRINVLRAWLAQVLPSGVPRALLQRLMLELPPGRGAVWQVGKVGQGVLRLQGRVLRFIEDKAQRSPG